MTSCGGSFLSKTYSMVLSKVIPGIVALTIRSRMSPQEFADCADKLKKYDVKIISMILTRRSEGDLATATMFLDFSQAKISLDDFLKIIAEEIRPLGLEAIDVPLTVGAANLVAFTLDDINGIIETAHEMFKAAGKAFLYYLGLGLGRRKAEEIISCSRVKDPLSYALLWAQSLGWGEFAIEREPGKIVVLARNLFECFKEKAKEAEARGFMFKGFLAGFLSKIWGKEVKVDEVKCTAKGDDVCVFEITLA
ncbi:MAG: V4R domain-containing protein [Candidatus Nezhaarchaeales archaeon]